MASKLLLVVVCILHLIAFSLAVVVEQRRSLDTLQVSINEAKTTDGASYLELKVPSRSTPRDGIWNFLEKYGFRYGDAYSRALLPSEVPRQPDARQCGFYVLLYLRQITGATIDHASIKSMFTKGEYSQVQIDEMRSEWAECVQGHIEG